MIPPLRGLIVTLGIGLFAASPSSTNYSLKAYDFGDGGGTGSSTNYKVNGLTNGQSGAQESSANYMVNPGLNPNQNAYVPPAASFTNTDNSYNHLKLILNNGNNPSDTTFAIAISPDNFVTTYYVQSDNSIGPVLGPEDRQTYAAWGGASGIFVTGLLPATTYTVKSKAYQGQFTETGYGPTASAATVSPQLSFSVATTASSTPPFNVTFPSLTPGTVFSTSADVLLTLSTNAAAGGSVYTRDKFNGLNSTASSYTLASATADLSSVPKGYGVQVISTGQGSGGPITSLAPFNGASNNVGILTTSLQQILSTPGSVTSGTATVRIKAKTDVTVPASNDYTDTLTFIAAMGF